MKKISFIFVVLVASAAVAFTRGYNSAKNRKNIEISETISTSERTTRSWENTGTVQVTEPTTIPEVPLFENEDVKIIGKGITSDGFEVELPIYIENKSEKNLEIYCRDFSVNGFMIDACLASDVLSGKKINDTIWFFTSDLEKNDLNYEDIKDIEFKFSISDRNDIFNGRYETDIISLNLGE